MRAHRLCIVVAGLNAAGCVNGFEGPPMTSCVGNVRRRDNKYDYISSNRRLTHDMMV
jgi:hypothetical protein